MAESNFWARAALNDVSPYEGRDFLMALLEAGGRPQDLAQQYQYMNPGAELGFKEQALQEQGRQANQSAGLQAMLGGLGAGTQLAKQQSDIEQGKYATQEKVAQIRQQGDYQKYMAALMGKKDIVNTQEQGKNERLTQAEAGKNQRYGQVKPTNPKPEDYGTYRMALQQLYAIQSGGQKIPDPKVLDLFIPAFHNIPPNERANFNVVEALQKLQQQQGPKPPPAPGMWQGLQGLWGGGQ
jgi:hypothetical protein